MCVCVCVVEKNIGDVGGKNHRSMVSWSVNSNRERFKYPIIEVFAQSPLSVPKHSTVTMAVLKLLTSLKGGG